MGKYIKGTLQLYIYTFRLFSTQLGDANLVQVLQGDVTDKVHVVITILDKSLIVLTKSNQGQPLC